MFKSLELISKSYISILFSRNHYFGFIILLSTFFLPSVGLLGLIGLSSTILFAEVLGLRETYLKYGFYLYNSLLVGMGIGFYYEVSTLTIVLTIISSIFTFLLTFGLNRIFINYGLSILSFPFAFISIILSLSTQKYSLLVSNILNRIPIFDITIPITILSEYFKALGHIIFLPYNIIGLIISIIIFFSSRLLFLVSIFSFLIGIFLHSLFIPYEQVVYSSYNFNFILIGMGIITFLIPSIETFILLIISLFISVLLIDSMEVLLNMFNIPLYTLPFNIVLTLLLLVLYNIRYKFVNWNIKGTPEESLNYYLEQEYRFKTNKIKIGLPFLNEWKVYQGFNGKWTHQGKWKYAYDFVIEKDGKTFMNEGNFLTDYYCFGENIVSPINGYVIDFRHDLPDNFIGTVDRINNWGNYIIIKSDFGYFVEISHLMQHSINVKVGDYIEKGQIIGKCGNSGYSPQPHIHIQVQAFSYLGSETLPFVFEEYIKNDEIIFYNLPKNNEIIINPIHNNLLKLKLTFVLDDKLNFEVIKNNEIIEDYSIIVKMNDKGEFFFEDQEKNKLYFYLFNNLFYFYEYNGKKDSYLKDLFKLLPKIPLNNKNVKYKDILPLNIKNNINIYLLLFNHKLIYKNEEEYYKTNMEVKSKFGSIKFDNQINKGFKEIYIKDKNITLKLKN